MRRKMWLLVLLVLLIMPLRIGYRVARTIAVYLPVELAEQVLVSENFRLFYNDDQEEAQFVLGLLEEGLADLQRWLPDPTPKPIKVRLHASQTSLQKALGAGDYAPTLGAYYLGRLELLAPTAWQPQLSRDAAWAYYGLEGPVVHELTHLLLDYQAVAAYPVWFSEGMAQYWEWRLRDYVWQEGDGSWRLAPHSLRQLTRQFVDLPEPIAYQEALSLVQFLYEEVGDAGMNRFLELLQQGQTFNVALEATYGENLTALEEQWKVWLMKN